MKRLHFSLVLIIACIAISIPLVHGATAAPPQDIDASPAYPGDSWNFNTLANQPGSKVGNNIFRIQTLTKFFKNHN